MHCVWKLFSETRIPEEPIIHKKLGRSHIQLHKKNPLSASICRKNYKHLLMYKGKGKHAYCAHLAEHSIIESHETTLPNSRTCFSIKLTLWLLKIRKTASQVKKKKKLSGSSILSYISSNSNCMKQIAWTPSILYQSNPDYTIGIKR